MSVATVPLGDVADFINGAAFSQSDWSNRGRKIIRIQNLTDSSKPFNRTTRDVKESIRVRPGDLLVSWSATLGVFEWQDEEAVLNQHIFRVVPNLKMIDRGYLKRVLESSIEGMKRQVHGATMKHITRGRFLGTQIPLPPIEGQRRIVAVLDAADALRAKRRQSLAKLDTLSQAIFIDMFGDPRIAAPPSVEKRTLGELTRARPICYGVLKPGPYVPDGVPLVRIMDLVDGEVAVDGLHRISLDLDAEFKRSRLEGGEVLLSIQGTIGRVAICPPDLAGANISRTIARISPDDQIDPEYLAEWLRLQAGRFTTSGSTRASLNIGTIRKMGLPIPERARQAEFVARVEKIRRRRLPFLSSAGELDTLFAAVQQRAFRGDF